jgi:integrase
MSIYRRRDHGKRSRFYTAEFTYRGQTHRQGGFVDKESARHWIDELSKRLRRGSVGYVKPMLNTILAPLIPEFVEYLRAKGVDDEYAYIAERRLTALAGECPWQKVGDITEQSVENWQRQVRIFHGKPVGNKTKNQFVQIAREFCDWLVKPKGLLPANPLDRVDLLKETPNPEYRRAGTLEEFDKLLATCASERRLYYIFRLYCPLRAKTIGQLTWRMMRLDDERPWIALPAAVNKSRADERSPLPMFLAQQLRRAKGKAKADTLVFPDPPSLDDFKADLLGAGVQFDDGKGKRRLDYHAFRKTLVRLCKRAGVPLDDASQLLHHKDRRTTQKHYDDDAVAPELSEAIERLPLIGKMRLA